MFVSMCVCLYVYVGVCVFVYVCQSAHITANRGKLREFDQSGKVIENAGKFRLNLRNLLSW